MKRYGLLLLVFMSSFSSVAIADTVKIPVGQQAPDLRDMKVPSRGMSKDNVEADFGEPLSMSHPVGEPLIGYWEYEHFYVYFENDRVLHTVFKQAEK